MYPFYIQPIFEIYIGHVAQLEEREPSKLKVLGSIPSLVKFWIGNYKAKLARVGKWLSPSSLCLEALRVRVPPRAIIVYRLLVSRLISTNINMRLWSKGMIFAFQANGPSSSLGKRTPLFFLFFFLFIYREMMISS